MQDKNPVHDPEEIKRMEKELDQIFNISKPSVNDYPSLTVLGNKVLEPRLDLECFPNPKPGKTFKVTLFTDEFTCLCPITGQPDFASIEVQYEPKDKIAESKSWKLYLWTFRNVGAFHEKVINDIADFFMEKVEPLWLKVTGNFNPRGGIAIQVSVTRSYWVDTPQGAEETAEVLEDGFPG